MHRSGTSALTRGLEVLGIELGKNLKPGIAGENDKGFFEDWTLSSINDELLALSGEQWDSLRATAHPGTPPSEVNALKIKALGYLQKEFCEAPWFAFKDPRSCRNVAFWEDVVRRDGRRPFFVIAFRNPMSVARSLQRRNGFSLAQCHYIWLVHYARAMAAVQDKNRICVEFDDLVADPRKVMAGISAAIDHPAVQVSSPLMALYEKEFLDTKLRSHVFPSNALELEEACSPIIIDMYEMLRREAQGGDVGKAEWQTVLTAFSVVAPHLDLISEFRRRAAAIELEKEAAESALVVARTQVLESDARIEALHAANEGREKALAQLARDSQIAIEQLSEIKVEREQLRQDLSQALVRYWAQEGKAAQLAAELASASERLKDEASAVRRLQSENHAILTEYGEQLRALDGALERERNLAEAMLRDAHEAWAQRAKLDMEQALERAAERMRQIESERAREVGALTAAYEARMRAVDAERRSAQQEIQDLHGRLMAAARLSDERLVQARDYRERAALLEVSLRNLELRCAAYVEELENREHEILRLMNSRDEQLSVARAAYARLADQLGRVYDSSSWRLTSILRRVKLLFSGGTVNQAVPEWPELPAPVQQLRNSGNFSTGTSPTLDPPVFFTICSRNFLAFAKTLHESLKEHHPESQFYVALCDLPDPPFDPSSEPFPFIHLDQLEIPNWREMSQRYNITEFNTAIKPFVFQHLMRKTKATYVVYLDPDIIVTSRLEELLECFQLGATAVLTPHVTVPAEDTEVSDVKMLQYGIYNLGFAAFRNSEECLAVLAWWGRRLLRDCVIKLEDGLFVDQKWADLFPAFLSNLHILRHVGFNVAYWNVAQRKVTLEGGRYFVNGLPMRFAHFSGANLDDREVYSRHSAQFRAADIGDLRHLLDEYREKVFGHGHEKYRRIPYAFSWHGASGVNLHALNPETEQNSVRVAHVEAAAKGGAQPIAAAYELVQTATQMAGGVPQLAAKAVAVFREGGVEAVRKRLQLVKRAADEAAELRSRGVRVQGKRDVPFNNLSWRAHILFIDWSTPRPDRDAGSITAFELMRILVNLGYDVTFIPSDLEYLGAYTEAVRGLGVRCLHRCDIGSIRAHLECEGAGYDLALLCRAPIADHYIDDIRRFSPRAKIVLNTSDLHFLRQAREAELSGDLAKVEASRAAEVWELGIINRCDLTIVMSEVEKLILAQKAPEADVRLIPLMFVDVQAEPPPFQVRRDIIFIGGFPHLPNVDAVMFFANEIFPAVRSKLPSVTWHIVGNAPPEDVRALGSRPGIVVHGHVPDIGPLFRQARLSVAPLRYGAGIKGKVGTSLAFGVPAVVTPAAVEGMCLGSEHVAVADTPGAFADAIVSLYLDEDRWEKMSRAGQEAMLEHYSVAAGQARMAEVMKELTPDAPQFDLHELKSYSDYQQLRWVRRAELARREREETDLIPPLVEVFQIEGFCALCGDKRSFQTSFLYAHTTDDGRVTPNWREHLACQSCGLQNRLRAGVHLFYALLRPHPDADIYITEQSTPLFRWLRDRHPRLVGSEYMGASCGLGQEVGGFRNEDLTSLTFADASFDYVLSFDVLEHVADDVTAFREVFRCLRPGGTLLFAAPFAKDRQRKVVRARIDGAGGIEHLLAPEYHGNPMDPEGGALCFRYFAWDVLDDLRDAGFQDCRVLNYWSRDFAYLGTEQFMFIARKPESSLGGKL
jgi:glycosyltransferase involved in cell wall biosynthesis/SAM-dependent methyltransferase